MNENKRSVLFSLEEGKNVKMGMQLIAETKINKICKPLYKKMILLLL